MYQIGNPSDPKMDDPQFGSLEEAEKQALKLESKSRFPIAIWDLSNHCNTLGLAWEGYIFR